MLLCSVSEAICFFLGEPGSPALRREAGRLWALGLGPLPLCCVSRGCGPEPLFLPPGALTPMPAVRVFALTSGVAVILDFLLQMSAFVALVSLDSRRQEVGGQSSPTMAPWGGVMRQRSSEWACGRNVALEYLGHVVPDVPQKVILFWSFWKMWLKYMKSQNTI